MDLPLSLTMEQEFQLKVYIDQADKLNAVEARQMLIEVMRQNMVKDNLIKHFMKKGGV